jgi:hypothetical protein
MDIQIRMKSVSEEFSEAPTLCPLPIVPYPLPLTPSYSKQAHIFIFIRLYPMKSLRHSIFELTLYRAIFMLRFVKEIIKITRRKGTWKTIMGLD